MFFCGKIDFLRNFINFVLNLKTGMELPWYKPLIKQLIVPVLTVI